MEMDRGRTSEEWEPNPPSASNLRRRRRSAWNPATWSPVTTSFAPNREYRAPGMAGGRRFAPTEHLAAEAVAAFVDGELGMTAHMRAVQHLAICPECMSAVDAQMSARSRLRAAGDVSLPAGLLGQLSAIPTREIDMTAPRSEPPTDRHEPIPPWAAHGTRSRMSRWRGR
ncbi:zf-HC2 domain-containing protein [Gordonia sp. CPCC 206044]|uniref:zf-HC2 domain-containing protein n=1 Tax=Gordonia sp. CPCC 206044 TaxID=3140793 RepID=UPI003AF3BBC0